MILKLAGKSDLPALKKLYKSAFPKAERKPFSTMQKLQEKGKMEILSIEKSGEFAGLMITVLMSDIVLLDYFAIDETARGKGIGSKALDLFSERYACKRCVLEIESVDENAKNNEQRIRRKAFYKKNGFLPNGVLVRLFGIDMELLTKSNYTVSFDEYYALYKNVLGKTIAKMVSER